MNLVERYSPFAQRRVGICGGASIPREPAAFCERLGAHLADRADGPILVSGGCKQRKGSESLSADWHTIDGARRRLRELAVDEETRIETFLPGEDDSGIEKFEAGKTIRLPNATPQARRFRMISEVDVLVGVAGGRGTTQNLDLALALDCPTLPLPMFGGAAEAFWDSNQRKITHWFGISDEVARQWRGLTLDSLPDSQLDKIAKDVAGHLVERLRRTCMVIMPFAEEFTPLYDEVIDPAINMAGFLPIRTDRLDLAGDVLESIRRGIETCDCALAVLTDTRPNVMYELGLAHARDKPVLLLIEKGGEGDPDLPFDIDNHFVLEYRGIDESLKDRIGAMLENVRKTHVPGRYLRFRAP
jgi:hypothetical protein